MRRTSGAAVSERTHLHEDASNVALQRLGRLELAEDLRHVHVERGDLHAEAKKAQRIEVGQV